MPTNVLRQQSEAKSGGDAGVDAEEGDQDGETGNTHELIGSSELRLRADDPQSIAGLFISMKPGPRALLRTFGMLDRHYNFSGLATMLGSWRLQSSQQGSPKKMDPVLPANIVTGIGMNEWFTKDTKLAKALVLHPMGVLGQKLDDLPIYFCFRTWLDNELQFFRASAPLLRLRLTHMTLPWHLQGPDSRERKVVGLRVLAADTLDSSVDYDKTWLRFAFNHGPTSKHNMALLLLPDRFLLCTVSDLLGSKGLAAKFLSKDSMKG
ncbi:unnamed protein product [Zymoseptoria tritici ST99CH_3D7]|uniref:Uncharacterized protein n=1 Tax=Zymoseptoria tritici (strain ST99CH_3D7) TaxID=1276538 RepID=A0A1X7RPL3_ZYMT9|nr:unnamed protein product [Zymoseptoria tritici ST99CH_3D7]